MAQVVGSRRSPYLLGALVLAHLLIISWQVQTEGKLSLLERGVLTVVSPFQRGFAATLRGGGSAFRRYVDLRGAEEENERLRERLRTLEAQAREQEVLAQQAQRLREVLGLRQTLPRETVAADVIAGEGTPWASTILVNKGSLDGVTLNAAVTIPSGVIGRVIAVGAHAAKIQLIVDRESGVGVQLERSRTVGVLEGLTTEAAVESGELPMRFVPALADVQVGDTVVTSGLDQIYPKGLVVGRVSRVLPASGLMKEVFVALSARLHEMEEVLIIRTATEPPELTETVR
jgi:rod shape-determining protein MreC